jgi:hypothetical protein
MTLSMTALEIANATDALKAIRREYAAGRATYDDMKAAAARLLELRREAEISRWGKAKTKISAVAIATLLRA